MINEGKWRVVSKTNRAGNNPDMTARVVCLTCLGQLSSDEA